MTLETIAEHANEIAALCHEYRVLRLELCAQSDAPRAEPGPSDADFLVHFDPAAEVTYVGAFHHLQEALSELVGQPVALAIAPEASTAVGNGRQGGPEARLRSTVYAA